MKTIAFINQKGGAGKTTTALNVGASLQRKGFSVLLIDLDAQGNLTTATGCDPNEIASGVTIYEVLKDDANVNDAIRATANGCDIIPTDIRQSDADVVLSGVAGRDVLLKFAIKEIQKQYDFVLLDCPPSLSIITIMALTACDDVVIPIQAQYFALNGCAQLINTINKIKKRLNPKLNVCGVVVTMYDGRQNLDKSVLESVEKAFPEKVFATKIRNNVSLAEAPACGCDVFTYKPECAGATDYDALTDEIIFRTKGEKKNGKQ